MVRVRRAPQLALAVALGCAGCSHVAPYERAVMTRRDMSAGDLSGPGQTHATQVHEGAMHEGAAVEAGCGCN
jgi:Domain of unknown function (DUF4266)